MKRTGQQNRSLHLYCRRLAEALDAAGYDMRDVKVRIQPTPEGVKESFVRPVLEAMWPDKDSTTELSTAEVGDLYEVLNRATAERLGISVPFPSEESLSAPEFLREQA